MKSRGVFLSAEWRHLALLNFKIDPQVLTPHVPQGTELDFYNGETFVSVVAFLFIDTKAFGLVPAFFHRNFEEINLRFYVTRRDGEQIKRGVVFIKEIVPKRILAAMARTFYKENYVAMPTSHRVELGKYYEYSWGSNSLQVHSNGQLISADEKSFERWVTEHYWGYTKANSSKTLEYEVKHPVWNLYGVSDFKLSADIPTLYGNEFKPCFEQAPRSVFLADGSPITVHLPRVI